MTFAELIERSGLKLTELAARFGIPYRTLQNWKSGSRPCPQYIIDMMSELLDHDANAKEINTMKAIKTPYKMLANIIPAHATVISSVSTAKFPIGAVLVRFDNTGIYALVGGGGMIASCDQNKARAIAESLSL